MPIYNYTAGRGARPAPSQPALHALERILDFLVEQGDYALRQLERQDGTSTGWLEILVNEGYLERTDTGGYRIGLRGLRYSEERALKELFQVPQHDGAGHHDADRPGESSIPREDTRPYRPGDSLSYLDMPSTFRNTLQRQRGQLPLNLLPDDLVLHETEERTRCATVLLLDQSGSMALYNKFSYAKRVALALQALVRSHYPGDSFEVVAFATRAQRLNGLELLRSVPHFADLFDDRVTLRVPIDAPTQALPEHFTNIQAALAVARKQLQRQPARNKQILCVTDGEPTAHLEGQHLVLAYPPSEATARFTLEEVDRCRRSGVTLSIFALAGQDPDSGLQSFVDRMARVARGQALYCNARQLGRLVLDRFLRGRRSRQQMG